MRKPTARAWSLHRIPEENRRESHGLLGTVMMPFQHALCRFTICCREFGIEAHALPSLHS